MYSASMLYPYPFTAPSTGVFDFINTQPIPLPGEIWGHIFSFLVPKSRAEAIHARACAFISKRCYILAVHSLKEFTIHAYFCRLEEDFRFKTIQFEVLYTETVPKDTDFAHSVLTDSCFIINPHTGYYIDFAKSSITSFNLSFSFKQGPFILSNNDVVFFCPGDSLAIFSFNLEKKNLVQKHGCQRIGEREIANANNVFDDKLYFFENEKRYRLNLIEYMQSDYKKEPEEYTTLGPVVKGCPYVEIISCVRTTFHYVCRMDPDERIRWQRSFQLQSNQQLLRTSIKWLNNLPYLYAVILKQDQLQLGRFSLEDRSKRPSRAQGGAPPPPTPGANLL